MKSPDKNNHCYNRIFGNLSYNFEYSEYLRTRKLHKWDYSCLKHKPQFNGNVIEKAITTISIANQIFNNKLNL